MQSINKWGYTLQSLAADSPLGEVWGYIGVKGDEVRAVILSTKIQPIRIGDGPGEIYCPCVKTYSVFVSNIINFPQTLKEHNINF
jgi:hypothetical protein